MIGKRTQKALARRKINGTTLGRPFGSINRRHVWDGKEKQILLLRSQGFGLTKIARTTNLGVETVYAFLKKRE